VRQAGGGDVRQGANLREVDVRLLQQRLVAAGIPEDIDPQLAPLAYGEQGWRNYRKMLTIGWQNIPARP
jgi:hypothetical protein